MNISISFKSWKLQLNWQWVQVTMSENATLSIFETYYKTHSWSCTSIVSHKVYTHKQAWTKHRWSVIYLVQTIAKLQEHTLNCSIIDILLDQSKFPILRQTSNDLLVQLRQCVQTATQICLKIHSNKQFSLKEYFPVNLFAQFWLDSI